MARNPQEKRTVGAGVRFTLLIVLAVLLYMLPKIFHFAKEESHRYVIAQSGSIDDAVRLQGVITRDEQLYKAVSDGVVEYYYPGGRLLSKNTVIASISDSEYYGTVLADRQEAINARIAEISADDTEYAEEFASLKKGVESSVQQFLKDKDPGRYASIYELKESMNAAVRQRQDLFSLLSSATARTLLEEQELYRDVENESSEDLWISEAGILSYAYDGYEGWDASMIQKDFFSEYDGEYAFLNINLQKVEKGDPLYRLVTSQSWYFTSFPKKTVIDSLELEQGYNIALYDGDQRLTGVIETLEEESEDTYKMVVRIQTRMTEYIDQRLITLTLSNNSYEGIKIPNSCLTDVEFYDVPSNCVYRSGSEIGVLVRTDTEDVFVPMDFEWNTDTDYYFSETTDLVQEGARLMSSNEEEPHTLGGKVTTHGVYVVNGVTEDFYNVEVLYQTDDYAIVKGIRMYDHVKILQ